MSSAFTGQNVKNPAIRRIHADLRELARDPSDQYSAAPFEDNVFEWHFTLRGPPATPFAGGVYHGRILLPSDYPFKPPNIVFLTPNGRFEVGAKICLSISAHHPEQWQPAWGLRLILEALISFFPTEAAGALGSLDWTAPERVRLARASVDYRCPKCGLARDLLPPLQQGNDNGDEGGRNGNALGSGGAGGRNKYAEQIREMRMHGINDEAAPTPAGAAEFGDEAAVAAAAAAATAAAAAAAAAVASSVPAASGIEATRAAVCPARGASNGRNPTALPSAPTTETETAMAAAAAGAARTPAVSASAAVAAPLREEDDEEPRAEFDGLMYVAVAIAAVIVAILLRKMLRQAETADGFGGFP